MNLDPRVGLVLGTWCAIAVIAAVAMVVHKRVTPKRAGEKPPEAKPSGGFWQKMGSYLVINALFFLLAWGPYELFALSVVMLGFVVMMEVGGSSRWCREGPRFSASPVIYGVSTAVMIAVFAVNDPKMSFKIFVLLGILHTLHTTFGGPRELLLNRAALAACSMVYVPLTLICHLYLKYVDRTGFLVVFYYMVVCATDSFGQIVGTIVGGRKLVPTISPGKTVSGGVGGLVAGVVVGLVVHSCLPNTPLPWVVLASLFIGVSASVGDLVVSEWKRFLGIKDFGANLGAHGGVIDRFDSMMLAASAFFLFTTFMPH